MPQALKNTFLSTRDFLLAAMPFLVLTFVLLAAAYWWLKPTPPKRFIMATGPAQTAYAEFGKRYAQELKRYGITVELRETEGSLANLRLLRDGSVDVGFVEGGLYSSRAKAEDELSSLGGLFLDPIWLFYRSSLNAPHKKKLRLTAMSQLQGLRVNIGNKGSGTPNLMLRLLEANHIDQAQMTLSRLDPTQATVALLAGDLDALVFVSAPESPLVQMLLMTPGISLMDFEQSEAYARRFPFLSAVTLPNGVVDLASNTPAQNIRMIAPTTSLIAKSNLHPALMHLLSMASSKLHGDASWFNAARAFPNMNNAEMNIAPEAERYIKNGEPYLQRQLPFWAANLVDRMWIALGIIIAILLPISKILPPLYRFRIRRRIFRWYLQLRAIENRSHELDAQPTSAIRDDLQSDLSKLERRVQNINVPLSYADELYALKSNIALVRSRISRSA